MKVNRAADIDSADRRQEMAGARRALADLSQLVWRLLAQGADPASLSAEGIGSQQLRQAARQALDLNEGHLRGQRRNQLLAKRYPRACHKWCPAEEARLLELYAAGKTLREMARVLGRHPQAVKERLRRIKGVAWSWPS